MKESKKVELLAPAGNYESFLGAVHAGADAVYLGGEKFGARAYADNFTTGQLCDAIRYAHLYGRKVYLTLNTLVKEKEMPQLYEYLSPFYEAGLDGVIIQDMGVFLYVKEHFPHLPLHVSTQMTITGTEGVRMLKELGAERIVPARELSLAEISQIKRETEIEIETFIHGAMCYCYSGQCLFSSILGGRSGNRGKCAQPCRLPYKVKGSKEKAAYFLSLKDMCTIGMLPELIGAGIDSFKIEGRMKKPEYAAGVTAVYRKYIDAYYERGEAAVFAVEKEDQRRLASLYIRSELQNGYYDRHNGASMVTKDKPGYNESDERLLKEIREKYIEKQPRIAITGKAFLKAGQQAVFSIEGNGVQANVKGADVQSAVNQPLTEADIRKQLEKCGGTPFVSEALEIEMEGAVFMPLKELNELRRQALEGLEEEIIKRNSCAAERSSCQQRRAAADKKKISDKMAETPQEKEHALFNDGIYISVQTKEQLKAVISLLEERKEQPEDLAGRNGAIQAVFVSMDIFQWGEGGKASMPDSTEKSSLEKLCAYVNGKVFAAYPYVMRNKDIWLHNSFLKAPFFAGALIRNMEELALLQKDNYHGKMITDAGLYVWNKKAAEFYSRRADLYTLPFELKHGEQKNVTGERGMQVVYGRLPMMVTANCIRKTSVGCSKGSSAQTSKQQLSLVDRYGKEFPVALNCRHCYNIIYNSVPLSLHRLVEKENGKYRLDFTIEDEKETKRIIEYFCRCYMQVGEEPPYPEYTTGHSKRGVD